MRKINNQRGSVGPLITILIIVIIFYLGIKLGEPYYRMYSLKIDTASIVNLDISQEDMQKRIYKTALDNDIPLDINNLIITKDPETGRVTVDMKWTDIIVLFGHPVIKIAHGINLTK
jgi:hypothetical protein